MLYCIVAWLFDLCCVGDGCMVFVIYVDDDYILFGLGVFLIFVNGVD